MAHLRAWSPELSTLVLAGLLAAAPGAATPAPGPAEEALAAIFSREIASPALEVQPSLEAPQKVAGRDLGRFFALHSDRWEVLWDTRSDRPHLLQGPGVPLLPGRGNSLTREDLSLPARGPISLEDIEKLLRAFLEDYPELFRVEPEELELDRNASYLVSPKEQIWLIEFRQIHGGVPVEGAKVFFRINQGNIVQLGTERVADVQIDVTPKISRAEAFAAALDAAEVSPAEVSEVPERGALRIHPTLTPRETPAQLYKGLRGRGYQHVLAWEVAFRRTGEATTYQALVDAQTGAVLRLGDANAHARVTGGIYPRSPLEPEEVRGMPLVAVQTVAGSRVTDADGFYSYPGGQVTSSLTGSLVRIVDNCGSRLLADSTTGDLAFGTSGGTNCTTPGIGGAGNTHATRTAYYHLTHAKLKALGYFPSNAWLNGLLTVNVNINQTCNAFWNGSTLNFYRSGGGCTNTGEIASIMVHEWGHGMDQNLGGLAPEQASNEAAGDTYAFLQTKDSCIGRNFQTTSACLRDLSAHAAGGPRTIARPSTIADNGGLNCDAFACPAFSRGPMGYQAHCESQIASTANWDLARRLVARWGPTDGWQRMERLWYLSVPTSQSAYQVVSGGTCNPSAVVNGCGASNWYRVYLAVDDDDGNLANGTPNACRIWDAFNIHGIACGSRPACTTSGPRLTGMLASGEYVYDDEDVTLDVTVIGSGPLVVRVYGGSLTVDKIETKGPNGESGVSGQAGGAPPTSGSAGGPGRDIVLETWPSRYGNTSGPWDIQIGTNGVSAAGGQGGSGGSGADAVQLDQCLWLDAQNGATGGAGGNGGNITIRASGNIDIGGSVDSSGGDGGNGGSGGNADGIGTSPGLAREGRNGGSGGNIVIEQTASAPAGSGISIMANHGSVLALGGDGGNGGTGGGGGVGGASPKPGGNGGPGGGGGSIQIAGRALSQAGDIASLGGRGGLGGDGGFGSGSSYEICGDDCIPLSGSKGAIGGLGGHGGSGGPIQLQMTASYSTGLSATSSRGGDGGAAGWSGSSGIDADFCAGGCPFSAFGGAPGSPSGSGGDGGAVTVSAPDISVGSGAQVVSEGGDGAGGQGAGPPGSYCCEDEQIVGSGAQGGHGGAGGAGADIALIFTTLTGDSFFSCGGDGGDGADGTEGRPSGPGGLGGDAGSAGDIVRNSVSTAPECTSRNGEDGEYGPITPRECDGS